MRRVLTPLAIGSLLWMAASTAQALGFGRISNTTLLGQPLNFTATVRLEADESLTRECVSAEVQSGDNPVAAGQVRVALDAGADANERIVRVTTGSLIDEPVVTVTVTLGCASRTSRKFVAFVDPPIINLAQAAPPEPAEPAPQRVEAPVPPVVAVVQATTPAAPVAARAPARVPAPASATVQARAPKPAPRPRPPAAIVVGSKAAAAATPAPPRASKPSTASMAKAAPVPVVPGAARLKLETTVPVAGARASEPGATAAVAAAAPAPAASDTTQTSEINQLLAKERERLQALEDSLNRLRAETQTNQKALVTLQARLKEAETARYANPLVYALAVLCGLLLLAVAALWWGRARSKREAQWWTPPTPTASAPTAPPKVPAPAVAAAQVIKAAPVASVVREEVASPLLAPVTLNSVIDEPSVFGGAQDTLPAPVTLQAWPDTRAVEEEARRELSVEELIDLEQQAEFFVVLGQDEAAIDLLMGHVRSTGGISPLPYLKLLEIYRRRGDYAAYERIRERFNRRFNAYAPDWDSDLQHGRALDEYPEIYGQIEAQWSEPLRVMKTVDSSLFRRQESSHTFDLPAYRELLFLYSIARDLVERSDGADSVDLLLPIDLDAPGMPISRLSATQAYTGPSADRAELTLDLDFSEPPAGRAGSDGVSPDPDFAPGSDFLGLPDNPPKPRGPGRR